MTLEKGRYIHFSIWLLLVSESLNCRPSRCRSFNIHSQEDGTFIILFSWYARLVRAKTLTSIEILFYCTCIANTDDEHTCDRNCEYHQFWLLFYCQKNDSTAINDFLLNTMNEHDFVVISAVVSIMVVLMTSSHNIKILY